MGKYVRGLCRAERTDPETFGRAFSGACGRLFGFLWRPCPAAGESFSAPPDGPYPSGYRSQGAVCQQRFYQANQGASARRKRWHSVHVICAYQKSQFSLSIPVAAELGRLMGQSLHPAHGSLGLLSADSPWHSSDHQGRSSHLGQLTFPSASGLVGCNPGEGRKMEHQSPII